MSVRCGRPARTGLRPLGVSEDGTDQTTVMNRDMTVTKTSTSQQSHSRARVVPRHSVAAHGRRPQTLRRCSRQSSPGHSVSHSWAGAFTPWNGGEGNLGWGRSTFSQSGNRGPLSEQVVLEWWSNHGGAGTLNPFPDRREPADRRSAAHLFHVPGSAPKRTNDTGFSEALSTTTKKNGRIEGWRTSVELVRSSQHSITAPELAGTAKARKQARTVQTEER